MAQTYVSPEWKFSRFAGGGSTTGNDVASESAVVQQPAALTVDAAGNVYVIGVFDVDIRQATQQRRVKILARPVATAPEPALTQMWGIAVNSSGRLFVSNIPPDGTAGDRIQHFLPGGALATYAGSATYGYEDGQATSARFDFPIGLAFANGDLFVADSGNKRIRRISSDGFVSTVSAEILFNGPYGVAVDSAGNVYVGDTMNHCVRKIAANGAVSTWGSPGVSGSADGNSATARFKQPRGLAIDGAGNVYIADSGNHAIRMIDTAGIVRTLAGLPGTSGTWTTNAYTVPVNGSSARFNQPYHVALDSAGNLYIADLNNNVICWGAPAAPVPPSNSTAVGTYKQSISQVTAGSFSGSMNNYLTASGLPPGLSLDPLTGVIIGTPTQAGIFPTKVYAYNGAGGAFTTVTFTISPANQSITFGALGNKTYGDSPFALSATASSGLTVEFEVASGPATISGSTVTLTGAGTVMIRATQPGNANYNAAPEVLQSFTVAPTFASWQLSKFTTEELANPGVSGPTAVFGLDGLSNLVKYALGLEPKQNVTSGLPAVSANGTDWVFTYSRPGNTTDVTYAVEVSTNLTSWNTSGVTHQMVSNGDSQVWRGSYPLTATKAFFRLKVTGTSTATTPPAGGISTTINAGSVVAPVSTSFVIPLFDNPLATGAGVGRISTVSTTTITSTGASWINGALATTAFPYAFQITSGSAAGAVFRITANTADSISTSGTDLTGFGITAGPLGDSFRLIPLDTLNTLFGATTLLGGPNPTDADTVILSSATQISYYYNTSLSRWVRTTGPTTDRGNIAIPFESTVTIVRKSSALTLRFTGQAPTTRFSLSVPNAGTTYTHTGFPTDVTLGLFSLQTLLPGWTSSSTASTADTLTVGIGATALTYFHNGTNWIRSTGPTTNRDAINVQAGTPIIIFKRGSSPGTSVLTRNLPYTP